MADALVSTLLEKLASVIQQEIEQEVRLIVGVEKEVENLSRTLATIQAVLKDAEKKQVMDNLVKLWLEDLKDVAYDMDDVLDEWSTGILKSQIQMLDDVDGHLRAKKTVCIFNLFCSCVCFKQIGLRHDIGHRIETIKERLNEIATKKDTFGLASNTNSDERRWKEVIRLETSYEIDESKIFGRDREREIIRSKVLSDSSQPEEVPIISIVGMGGLGKTTLAQLVFSDDRVKTHFEKRVWVCVSEPFDKVRIAKEIITGMGEQVENNISWPDLHHQLSKSIEGRDFLLVLDDVWTEDSRDWEPFHFSLNHGARKSRIVVTTRNEKVAKMMGKADTYNLGKLSDEDCWRLLSSIAFSGEKSEKLERIGWKIANKCKGVPLSAKTLGGLLRFRKPTIQDWQDVLESEIWELQEVEKEILPSLLLSYYDLPSHMKRCFLYCAIFPKDHKIEKEKLINLWMAQGFLDESSMGRRTSNPDMTGELYLNNLVMRSFLQDVSEKYKAMYSIHDLLHDLAQYLTTNDCYVVSATNIKLEDFNSSKARHLTLILNGGNMDSVFPSTSTFKAKKNLRTFQVLMNPGKYDYISLTTSIVNIFKQKWAYRAATA